MIRHLVNRGICFVVALLLAACAPQVAAISSTPASSATEPPSPTATEFPQSTPTPRVIQPELVRTIAGSPNPLKQPVDAAVDSAGNLFVLDAGNNRVQVFDPEGKFVTLWGSAGTGEGQFNVVESRTGNSVGGIAVGADGNVYVADTFNSRIQKFDASGKFLGQWGSKGESDGQFLRPSGVEVDAQGNVYVLDVYTDVIQKFDPNGQFLLELGAKGGGNKRNNDPGYMALDADGLIYECDSQLSQVEVYGPDGKALSSWKLPWGPTGIALDGKGNVLVTLPRSAEAFVNNHVWAFDPQGNLLYQFAGTNNTMGIVVDTRGLLYLVEEGASVVQVLKLP